MIVFYNNKIKIQTIILSSILSFQSGVALATDEGVPDLFSLSLSELLEMKVSSASGVEESLRTAPAAMVIITAKNIRNRGYTSLWEVFHDLPGFDTIGVGQSSQVVSYQRGYRTPLTTRTLFLVNGKTQNHLWSHAAYTYNQYGMQNIERIEVMYGPAGALYGPNAFLGVVNVITKRPNEIDDDYVKINIEAGSFDTKAVDISAGGTMGELAYSISYKTYRSDEAGLNDMAPWGFMTNALLSNKTIWGPVLKQKGNSGDQYGKYANPSDEDSVMAELGYKDIILGYTKYSTSNGYGMAYAADHGQPNEPWIFTGENIYLEHHSQLTEQFKVKTLLSKRENRTHGRWTEAEPDWNADLIINSPSFVSSSNWNSLSSARLFKQDYEYTYSNSLSLTGGLKFEKKALNKAYEICYYWADALCAALKTDSSWPTEWGPGIYHSSADELIPSPPTQTDALSGNIINTIDKGTYLQGMWVSGDWHMNAGIRYDNNSIYGSSFNPRASLIWKLDNRITLKALYGEAFQEPAPKQLFGGWSGRKANQDLKPEEMTNIELIAMYQGDSFVHDLSFYRSDFENVIKEEAENAGTRNVYGLEYRGNFSFNNVIENSGDITGYIYYTYTKTESSVHYDHTVGAWVQGAAEIGDIAPHKINLGVNLPVNSSWNVNLRLSHVSDRELYSRNPLSDPTRSNGEREAKAYTTVDVNVIYDFGSAELALKIKNLLDETYLHPGSDSASSGDDFTRRALGYGNSLFPQVGRNWMLSLKWNFD